jgi:hypothetical protein
MDAQLANPRGATKAPKRSVQTARGELEKD